MLPNLCSAYSIPVAGRVLRDKKMRQIKLSRNTAIVTMSMRGKCEYETFGGLKTLVINIHTINLVYCLV